MQSVLEKCNSDTRERLASELRGHVLEAVESPHANHVVQRVVELTAPHFASFVLQELDQQEPGKIVRHKYGSRVLERILEHFYADRRAQERVCAFLNDKHVLGEFNKARDLCFDVYGTFVVQHVLEYGTREQQLIIYVALRCDLWRSSLDYNAVGVLEKALVLLPLTRQMELVQGIIDHSDKETSLLVLMATSRRGLPVLERVERVARREAETYEAAREQVRAHQHELEGCKEGRRLMALFDLAHNAE